MSCRQKKGKARSVCRFVRSPADWTFHGLRSLHKAAPVRSIRHSPQRLSTASLIALSHLFQRYWLHKTGFQVSIWCIMAPLSIDTSPVSSPGPSSPHSNSDMGSPMNVNAIACRLHMQHKDEQEDDVAGIITFSVDEVFEDGQKSGHCLARMECLSASSGSSYSTYGDEEPQCQSPRGTSEGQEPRRTLDWVLPESVEWDSNSETQYSRSDTYTSSASVGYVKIVLSATAKPRSSSGKVTPPRQVRLDLAHILLVTHSDST